ncbi:MAG: serine/threonine protein phosphatase, partial [Bacteroidota bacterium]|nr:serine/threonine protein phosphatase [Bacteroidota bacterium]
HGYADQFGGTTGKKMMTKNFKKLLLQIHQFPLKEQKEKLADFFKQWKGDLEQVDDVLVAGFKV